MGSTQSTWGKKEKKEKIKMNCRNIIQFILIF